MKRLAVVLLCACVTASETPVTIQNWRLVEFSARQFTAWKTHDTSANRLTMEFAGAPGTGGARITGAWFATAVSDYGDFTQNIVPGTPYEGRYQIWGDTTYLRDLTNADKWVTWLSALAFTYDRGDLVGRWDGEDGWFIVVRFRRVP